jgi:hypothetical protein
MWISAFSPLLYGVISGLAVYLIVRPIIRAAPERRAWGTGPSRPPLAKRREIRRAVRGGRAVADRHLAGLAIRYGEEFGALLARMPAWLVKPPRWLYLYGRIFFPVMGTLGLFIGVSDRDPNGVVGGIVLLCFTALYLPVTARRTQARRERRVRRIAESIDANRRLLSEPSGPYLGRP